MPAHNKLPTAEVLADHLSEGLTYEGIAAKYDVTRSAVAQAIRKAGLVRPQPRYGRHEIPWRVLPEHQQAHHLKWLRRAIRRQRGEKFPESTSRSIDHWLATLRASTPEEPHGCVIVYWPDGKMDSAGRWWAPGFHLVPRVPARDGDGLVRRPG